MFNQKKLLEQYLNFHSQQVNHAFVSQLESVLSLDSSAYHLTASGIVINGGSILLVYHRYIKEWMQPGGHIDLNEKPYLPLTCQEPGCIVTGKQIGRAHV